MRTEEGIARARGLRVGLAVPATLIVGMFALVAVLAIPAAAAPASESAVIKMQLELAWNNDIGGWWGSLTGGIIGYVAYMGDPAHSNWQPGMSPAVHFYEVFTIFLGPDPTPRTEPLNGESYIRGTDAGIYNLKTWFFMADGWVTDASPDCAELIGYHYHEYGVTTDPFAAETDGVGKVFMAPP